MKLTEKQIEDRWNNAVLIARQFNSYIHTGHIILNENGNRVPQFVITDTKIYVECSSNVRVEYFDKTGTHASGLNETVRSYTTRFKKWTVAKKIVTLIGSSKRREF